MTKLKCGCKCWISSKEKCFVFQLCEKHEDQGFIQKLKNKISVAY